METAEGLKNRLRRSFKRPEFVVASILSVGTLFYTLIAPGPVSVEVARVERKNFHEVVKSDGILRSRERYVVIAWAEGDMKRVHLKAGDPVKKGQVITELFWDIKYDPVKAPADGIVSKVFRESAGFVNRSEPIIEIVDPRQLEAAVELLTTDAARVSVGDPAKIENWGGPVPLEATVVGVSKAGFVKQSALGVEEERTEVKIELKDLPEGVLSRLGSTFHVDVSIQISSTPNALVIPEGALFREGADWAVYQVKNGKADKKVVSPIARSNGLAMIGNEFKEGDLIVNFPGDLVKEGTRVRSQR